MVKHFLETFNPRREQFTHLLKPLLKRIFSSGYCQQMDVHIPQQTVREALLFSAKLRQPPSVTIDEKEA